MTILDGQALGAEAPKLEAAPVDPTRDHAQLCAQYAWLRAVSRSLVRDPWSAEDVAHETLLAALASPPRDTSDAQHMRAWLGRVAFNLSRLGARKAARRHAREVRVARKESLPAVSEELELAGTSRLLDDAVAALPEPYRSVVRLRYYEGLSTAAIAEHTGTSELAVRKRLWRARLRLRETLERGSRRGQLWALALAWRASGLRAKGLAAAAAGVVVGLGGWATWSAWPRAEAPVSLARATVEHRHAARLAAQPGAATENDGVVDATLAPQPTFGRTRPVAEPPPRPPHEKNRGTPPSAVLQGVVLDLEAHGQAGLAIVAPGAPDEVLATTDALGRFQLTQRESVGTFEARGAGWTTLVRAAFERGSAGEQPIVVAPVAPCRAHVQDEAGRPLAEVRCEVQLLDTVFAALDFPVRLASSRLSEARTDATGSCALAELARGAGIVLHLEADGFEALELDTSALAAEAWISMKALPDEGVLAGTVLHRDGRPAAGARVALARASTRADARGHYRLPLRGVRGDSCLEATDSDGASAPLEMHHFGARFAARPNGEPREHELDLVLGEHHDHVTGRIRSPSAAGWLVAAFASAEDASGSDEEPAALTHSDAEGAFSFQLPQGRYDLYALAPEEAWMLACPALSTRGGSWDVAVAATRPLEPARASLRDDEGRVLAGTEVVVRVRLDGATGRRALAWRELTSDVGGAVAFQRDPTLALELAVANHGTVHLVSWTEGLASQPILVPRPASVQVRGADEGIATCSVLDGDGHTLSARGPLHEGGEFGFHAGNSPVLDVPPEARWLELRTPGCAALRLPLDPRPGATQLVRP